MLVSSLRMAQVGCGVSTWRWLVAASRAPSGARASPLTGAPRLLELCTLLAVSVLPLPPVLPVLRLPLVLSCGSGLAAMTLSPGALQ